MNSTIAVTSAMVVLNHSRPSASTAAPALDANQSMATPIREAKKNHLTELQATVATQAISRNEKNDKQKIDRAQIP